MDVYKKIIIKDWQQFQTVDLNFNRRVTILTGANGSGKSTILRMLAKALGWNFFLERIPVINSETKEIEYQINQRGSSDLGNRINIGELRTSTRSVDIIAPKQPHQQRYQFNFSGFPNLKGIFFSL